MKSPKHSKGRLWNTDKNGYLKNDAALFKIQPEFRQIVEEAKYAYLKELSPYIHSLYLTGSIPRGVATPYVSDLDGFGILKKNTHVSRLDLSKIKSDLLHRHPEITDIQMELWEWKDVFSCPKECVSEYHVILKLNSACLYGEDLSCGILPIKPDIALANTEIIQLKNDIEETLREIDKNPSASNIQYWCKRIMKNMIRAGFYMVIPSARVFTRDLAICSERFLQHYPEMKNVKECQKHIEQLMTEAAQLQHFLKDGYGTQILAQTEKWLDSHNPERDRFLKRMFE